MPTSLTNSLTHHFPLSNAARKLSATNRAERLPESLKGKKLEFCPIFFGHPFPFLFLPQSTTLPCVTQIVGTFRLRSGANKSCADSKQRVPARKAVILLLPKFCGVLKGVDGGSVWEKRSGPSPKKKQAGVYMRGCRAWCSGWLHSFPGHMTWPSLHIH